MADEDAIAAGAGPMADETSMGGATTMAGDTSMAGETPMGDSILAGSEDDAGMDRRRERVRVETGRHRIVGDLTLARDGYRSRVSDVLNAPERDFITLTDATVQPLDDGGPTELHPFVTIARRHIVFAVAAGEEG